MIEIIALILAIVVYFKVKRIEIEFDKYIKSNNIRKNDSIEVSNSESEFNKPNTTQSENLATTPDAVATQNLSPEPQYENDYGEYEELEFITWLKDNWILKLGILLIVVGFGWFVSYAFMNNWIGPVGKVTLGFILGAAITLFGDFRMKKYIKQGGIFLIFGVIILMISVFAGRFVYSIFDPITVLVIVTVISAYVALASLRYDNVNLATAGLFVAALAPTLTSFVNPEPLLQTIYISVVCLSYIWLNNFKNWRELGAVSSIIFLVYTSYYGLYVQFDQSILLLLIGYAVSLALIASNVKTIIKFGGENNESDVIFALVNGILILVWTLGHGPELWQSLLLSGWMIVFAITSFILFAKTNTSRYFFIYSLISIVYLVIATALELDGPILALAYIFESAVISISAYAITSKKEVGESFALLMIGPAAMTLPSFYSDSWRTGIFHQDFALLLSMGLVLCGLGLFYYFANKEDSPELKSGELLRSYSIMIITGTVYLYTLVWLITHSIYDRAEAVGISLTIYAIIGLGCYIYGKVNQRLVYRNYGATLIILVVVRLVLIEVWDMDLVVRIITFFVIGLLFVATAFIGNDEKPVDVNQN